MIENLWVEWVDWWASVTPEFAFLLALPFAVAVAGLLGGRSRKPTRRP